MMSEVTVIWLVTSMSGQPGLRNQNKYQERKGHIAPPWWCWCNLCNCKTFSSNGELFWKCDSAKHLTAFSSFYWFTVNTLLNQWTLACYWLACYCYHFEPFKYFSFFNGYFKLVFDWISFTFDWVIECDNISSIQTSNKAIKSPRYNQRR